MLFVKHNTYAVAWLALNQSVRTNLSPDVPTSDEQHIPLARFCCLRTETASSAILAWRGPIQVVFDSFPFRPGGEAR